jgi:N-acetylglutamate synthase-like GNAT family acetyltransferase
MVQLRDAGVQDVPAITRLLTGLSAASFRSRFQQERPSPAMVQKLACIDRIPGTQCIIAAPLDEPGRLIAEARYVPTSNRTAEIALTIADQYQHAGLGQILMDALAKSAAATGLEKLQAVVNLDNTAMLRLLDRHPWVLAEATDECRMATLEISATGGVPGWPPGRSGQRILVERRSWYDDRQTARLRAAGHSIRQCTGPDQRTGRHCPLVTSGQCQLAAEADQIVCLLPGDDDTCGAVAEAHQANWPHKLAD